MFLRREVHNPFRSTDQIMAFRDKDVANPHFVFLASGSVSSHVLWIRLLEHESDTFSHNANRVHSIDKGLRFRVEQVAFGEGDHWKYHPGLVMTFRSRLRLEMSASTHVF